MAALRVRMICDCFSAGEILAYMLLILGVGLMVYLTLKR